MCGKSKKKGREVVKKKECRECPALCCRDLAILISRPRTKSEIDSLKWQLHFDTVSVRIRNRRWYLLIKGKCIYLDRNNLCKIYDRRPSRCRRHNPPECEFFGEWFDESITTPEELEAYLSRRKLGKTSSRVKPSS